MIKGFCETVIVIIALILLNACTNNAQSEDIHVTSIQDIENIYIDYRSTNVNIISTEEKNMKATLFLYDNGPGIVMDKGNRNINIRVKSDITRLLKIGRKPLLEIQIPTTYVGEMIFDGSSGNIIGEQLEAHKIQINGSSGNVQLNFNNFQDDVDVKLSSGNIDVSFNKNELDALINLKSNSGRRSVDFLLDNHEQTKKMTKGVVGRGKHEINLETSSGNISVK